jgi:hypothetical protein
MSSLSLRSTQPVSTIPLDFLFWCGMSKFWIMWKRMHFFLSLSLFFFFFLLKKIKINCNSTKYKAVRVFVFVSLVCLFAFLSRSHWRTFLTYSVSENAPRESGSNMVHYEATKVRPDPLFPTEETRMKIKLVSHLVLSLSHLFKMICSSFFLSFFLSLSFSFFLSNSFLFACTLTKTPLSLCAGFLLTSLLLQHRRRRRRKTSQSQSLLTPLFSSRLKFGRSP